MARQPKVVPITEVNAPAREIQIVRFTHTVPISSANEMLDYVHDGRESASGHKTKIFFDEDPRFIRVETNVVDLIPVAICAIRLKGVK